MTKKSQLSPEDEALFRNTMRNTKPIKSTKVNLATPTKRVVRPKPEDLEDEPAAPIEELNPVGREDTLNFARPGIHHKIIRNLRHGKYNIDDVLDLHGLTVPEARTALTRFLVKCQHKGFRHILIIHGKGRKNQPILKNELNHWLRQTERVLAFCTPLHKDGRSGALYVLLSSFDNDHDLHSK